MSAVLLRRMGGERLILSECVSYRRQIDGMSAFVCLDVNVNVMDKVEHTF